MLLNIKNKFLITYRFFFISLNNLLNERMAYNVFMAETENGDTFYIIYWSHMGSIRLSWLRWKTC